MLKALVNARRIHITDFGQAGQSIQYGNLLFTGRTVVAALLYSQFCVTNRTLSPSVAAALTIPGVVTVKQLSMNTVVDGLTAQPYFTSFVIKINLGSLAAYRKTMLDADVA